MRTTLSEHIRIAYFTFLALIHNTKTWNRVAYFENAHNTTAAAHPARAFDAWLWLHRNMMVFSLANRGAIPLYAIERTHFARHSNVAHTREESDSSAQGTRSRLLQSLMLLWRREKRLRKFVFFRTFDSPAQTRLPSLLHGMHDVIADRRNARCICVSMQ